MNLTDYFRTFGHDLEISERKQKAAAAENLEGWVREYATGLCQAHDRIAELTEAAGLTQLAGQAFLYQILSGAIDGGRWNEGISGGGTTIPRYRFLPWQMLLETYLLNRPVCSYRQAADAVAAGRPLFSEQGGLTRGSCGTFWQKLPAGDHEELLSLMAWGYELFIGDERGRAEVLSRYLSYHRPAPTEAAPPAAADEEEYSLTERIPLEFPELSRIAGELGLQDAEVPDILGKLYVMDPDRAITLWRRILDRMETEDPADREVLIYDCMELVWMEEEALGPLLDVLERDDRLAGQLFSGSYTGFPQEQIMEACRILGRAPLLQKLQGLLDQNPNL